MPKKRLNKKLVIMLTLFAFVMMTILSVLMLRQLQSGDPRRFVDLAEQFESKGEWMQAALFYHKAWERSNDWAYIVAQGDMLLRDGEVRLALQNWQEARVKQPELIKAHINLVETLLELARLHGRIGNWIMVQEAAESMLEVAKAPADQALAHHANGLALVNLASQATENADRGMAQLQEAARLAPRIVEYAIAVASQHMDREEFEEGERLFRELLDQNTAPGSGASAVRRAYARYLAGEQRIAEADRYFREGVTLAEGDPAAYLKGRLAYAEFLAQRWARAVTDQPDEDGHDNRFNQLDAILRECIESDPDAFEPYLQLGVLYNAAKRYQDVVDVCERRLRQGFSRKGLEATRNKLDAFRLMILASDACVAQAVAESAADNRQAREEWLSRAQQYVDDANAEYPNNPRVLSQSGRIKLAQGRDRDALDDFRKADEAYRAYDVLDWGHKLRLAKLHLNLNEPGAAKAVLEEVLPKATARGTTPFWLLYAQTLLASAEGGIRIDEAAAQKIERVLAEVSLRDPDNAEARHLRAALLERLGKPEQAAPLAESSAVRALLEARERAQNGDHEGAITVVRAALEDDPANLRLVGTAVHELLRRERTDEASTIVDRALTADPDSAFLQKLAVLTRSTLSPAERDEALLDIIEAQDDAYQRCWDLIDFHWRQNDFAKALTYFDEAEQHLIDKDTPQARDAAKAQHRALLKAKLFVAAQVNDEDAMAAARDSAARYNVDGAHGKSILGLYHMYRDEADLAIIALTAAVEAQPTDARSLTHLGQCLQGTGRMDEARTYLERAIRMNPNEGLAHKALAADAKRRGNADAYERHLRLCGSLLPGDPWVQDELLLQREQEDPERAIALREAKLADNPDDPANLLRLAILTEKVDQLDKADGYYDRLMELRGDEQNLVATVARYYRRTHRPQRALEAVTRYAESKPPGPQRTDARILVAAHYLAQRDLDLVETTLLNAADEAETFQLCHSLGDFYLRQARRPKEALRWYDRAVELSPQKKPPKFTSVLGARIVCLLDRSINDLELARRYVEDFVTDFPNDPQGLLWESEIHARQGKIETAVESLTRFLAKMPNDPPALFKRAQYYAALGRTTGAIDDLQTLKRVSPTALRMEPRILLAKLYFQAGRNDDWVEELESIVEDAPESVPALEELVAAYINEMRLVEADRVITAQINRARSGFEARWFFLRGRVSLELKNFDKAFQDFHRGADISDFSAESLATVMEAYVRLVRFAEGVEYYEQHAASTNRTPRTLSLYARLLVGADRSREAVDAFREAMSLATTQGGRTIGIVINEVLAAFPEQPAVENAISLLESDVPGGMLARANNRILVRLYRQAGRDDKAVTTLEQLIRTAPDDQESASLHTEMGEVYQLSGKPRDAVEAYEKALEYDPDNWIVLNNIAYVRSDELREYTLALPYAKRAVAIADVPATLDTLGWIYVGLGEYSLAIAELSRSVRLGPGDPLSYYHLGEAYRRNQQFIEAANILRRARDVAEQGQDETLLNRIETALEKVGRRHSTD